MLQAARQRQDTDAFKALYKKRAGIEGTISQAVQAFGLRRTRYVGLAKTHLQHLATAAAMNLTRLAAWLDRAPKAHTRQSRFLALQQQEAREELMSYRGSYSAVSIFGFATLLCDIRSRNSIFINLRRRAPPRPAGPE